MTHRDINELIAEREAKLAASDEELIEARERADAGLRLALPQFMESLDAHDPPSSQEPVSKEAYKRTGSDLLDIRAALIVIGRRYPLEGYGDIHGTVNDLVNRVDHLGSVLSERSPS
jgi:hypothetical protein